MTNGIDEAFGHGAENGHCPGLTKRELFAAMAMQGICASDVEAWPDSSDQGIAQQAVVLANALIEALNK